MVMEYKIGQIIINIWDDDVDNYVTADSCNEASLRINSILGMTVDTAQLEIFDRTMDLDIRLMSDIKILRILSLTQEGYIDETETIFGGIITECTTRPYGHMLVHSLSCQDYGIFLDTTFVEQSFRAGFSDRQVIQKCFEKADWGTLAKDHEISADQYVETGIVSMASQNYEYASLADILNTICSYSGYSYHVDYDKELHYFSKGSNTADFTFTDYPETSSDISYRKVRSKRDGSSIRNQFIVYGKNLKSTVQNAYITANGIDNRYLLGIEQIGQDVVMLSPPGEDRVVIEVDGIRQKVGVAGSHQYLGDTSTDPEAVDVLISPVSKWIEFYATPAAWKVIHLQYVYAYNYGQVEEDHESISKYKRPFMKIIKADDANSIMGMNLKAQSYKEQFSNELHTITFSTDSHCMGSHIMRPGMWVRFINDWMQIDKEFLIYSVTTIVHGGTLYEYEVELRSWWQESA